MTCADGVVSSSVPYQICQSLASVLSVDVGVAGWILGLTVVVALLITLAWLLGDILSGTGIFIPAAFGLVVVVGIGWWPIWAVIFIALILVFIIINPFGSSR